MILQAQALLYVPNKYGHNRDRLYLVLEVGLEPTKPKGGRFTVSCDCHYTIPACIFRIKQRYSLSYYGAAFRTRTEDLLFTKQLL